MVLLILGLVLFLGAHSVQIFAAPQRAAFIARRGAGPWKGLYSALSGVGFVLIIVGYGQARDALPLWPAPGGARALTALLVLAGFILLTAAYFPGNHLKAAVKDPMVLGVGAWALGHLASKSSPPALALFGGFLVWAILDFISLRGRADGAPAAKPSVLATAGTLVVGLALWLVFAMFGHRLLIGVSPMA